MAGKIFKHQADSSHFTICRQPITFLQLANSRASDRENTIGGKRVKGENIVEFERRCSGACSKLNLGLEQSGSGQVQ
jgi:hypothetical protein